LNKIIPVEFCENWYWRREKNYYFPYEYFSQETFSVRKRPKKSNNSLLNLWNFGNLLKQTCSKFSSFHSRFESVRKIEKDSLLDQMQYFCSKFNIGMLHCVHRCWWDICAGHRISILLTLTDNQNNVSKYQLIETLIHLHKNIRNITHNILFCSDSFYFVHSCFPSKIW